MVSAFRYNQFKSLTSVQPADRSGHPVKFPQRRPCSGPESESAEFYQLQLRLRLQAKRSTPTYSNSNLDSDSAALLAPKSPFAQLQDAIFWGRVQQPLHRTSPRHSDISVVGIEPTAGAVPHRTSSCQSRTIWRLP